LGFGIKAPKKPRIRVIIPEKLFSKCLLILVSNISMPAIMTNKKSGKKKGSFSATRHTTTPSGHPARSTS